MESALTITIQILVVLFSIVLHEVSHGAMAYSLGDDTAKRLGRLTLNPIKHLDFFGSIILPLLTFLFAGFAFGYAKPVPYNPYNLRDQKYGAAKVAAAGPLTNIAIALLFAMVFRFAGGFFSTSALELLQFIIFLNLILAVFNLVPIPPLDGHWFVLTFVPDRYYRFKETYVRMGFILLLMFLFYGFGLILPVVFWLFRLFTGV